MDTRAVSRQDRRQTRCLETTFWPPTLSRDNYFCLETTFLSSTLCRDNLFCLETAFLSPTLSRDNVFAHLETTKKTSYNKKDNLRRYTPRRGNYGKITTQGILLAGGGLLRKKLGAAAHGHAGRRAAEVLRQPRGAAAGPLEL